MTHKGQGASEYIMILAFMLVVSLTVVYLLSDQGGMQTSISQSESMAYWSGQATPVRIEEATHLGGSPCPPGAFLESSGYALVLKNADERETISVTGVKVNGESTTFCLLGKEPASYVPIDPGRKAAIAVNFTKECTIGKNHEISLEFIYSKGDIGNRTQVGSKALVLACNNPADMLFINTSSLPTAVCDSVYPDTQMVAVWGDGRLAIANWTATGLPIGMSLSQSGILSGNPCEKGTFSVAFSATSGGAVATRTLTLVITGGICPCSSSGLMILTGFLPNGNINTEYNSTRLNATGGAEPYLWSVANGTLPNGLTLNNNTGNVSGIPTTIGNFSFTIQAADQNGSYAQKRFTVNIYSQMLTINSTLPNGNLNVPYSATLQAVGGLAPYSWSVGSGSLPGNLSLNSTTGVLSGTPNQTGNFTFSIYVNAADNSSSSKAFTINIANNVYITTASFPIAETWSGYAANLSASGGSLPYSWSLVGGSLPPCMTLRPSGLINASDGYTAVPCGGSGTIDYTFTAKVTDNNNNSDQKELTIRVDEYMRICGSLPNARKGVLYAEEIPVCGVITYPLNWTLRNAGTIASASTLNFKTGLNGSPNWGGEIQGTPNNAGSYWVRVRVTDALNKTDSENVTIIVEDSSLSISPNSFSAGCRGNWYWRAISVSGGSPPYNWSVSSGALPTGLSLGSTTSSSNEIEGQLTEEGNFTFTIRVQSGSDSVQKTYTIEVTPPCISIDPDNLDGYVGTPYSIQMEATGGDGSYTWSKSGTLPAGLSLSPTGLLSGTPTTENTYSFTINVEDGEGIEASRYYGNVQIRPSSLAITTSSPINSCSLGSPYSKTFTASGGSGSYTWLCSSCPSQAPPSGLVLLDTGILSGTPSGSPGTYSFTVQVNDGYTTKDKSFSITLNSAALSVLTTNLDNGNNNTAYSESLSATGGTSPYTWSKSSGSFPPGLDISSGGVLSGTPVVNEPLPKDFTFTLQVADSTSPTNYATRTFTISIGQ